MKSEHLDMKIFGLFRCLLLDFRSEKEGSQMHMEEDIFSKDKREE